MVRSHPHAPDISVQALRGCSSMVEHSAFNRLARVQFPSSPPQLLRRFRRPAYFAAIAQLDQSTTLRTLGSGVRISLAAPTMYSVQANKVYAAGCNQHGARFDSSVRSHGFSVGFSSVAELRVVIPSVVSSILTSQPKVLSLSSLAQRQSNRSITDRSRFRNSRELPTC